MPTVFPPEILEEIFENLDHDKTALHSSLLVNRSWCRNAVPILWRQPFRLLNKPSVKLVQTYIISVLDRSLSDNIQQKMLIKCIKDLSQPFFNYPIFLKDLRTITLTQGIKGWVQGIEIHFENELDGIFYNKVQIVCYLYSILIKSFTSVQTILHCSLDHFPTLRKHVKFLPEYPKYLRSLQIEIKYDDDILSYLTQIFCNTLEEIWIGPLNSGVQLNDLANLVRIQTSLKDFRLYGPRCEWLVVTFEIISALSTQHQTLHTIRFSECNFPCYNFFDYLGACQNLKNLEFHNCDFPEDQTSWCNVTFPKLEILSFVGVVYLDVEKVATIVKNNKRNLTKVFLPCMTPQDDLTKLTEILVNCKNVTCFAFWANIDAELDAAFRALETFNKLECLSIDSEDGSILNSDQLSKLEKVLTPTLRHLELCVDTSAESFEQFLTNLTARLESLTLSWCPNISNEHIKVITRYARRNPNLRYVALDDDRSANLSSVILDEARQVIPSFRIESIDSCEVIRSWFDDSIYMLNE
ncbi:11098_t:CDS:1 [Funneliformis geosporum]|uniref:11098_t:CDS:1 n=1 Tax=Funneliformis geosporum TaxID=1117311 RepID=A0A9W4WVH2_9GLOM|nr:11098_t:CDS:1 [Funneliformis geosporum]